MAQLVQDASTQTVSRASLGDTLAIALRRHPLMLQRFARTYGDRLHIKAPGVSIFFLFHPDDIREVLVVQGHKFRKGLGVFMLSRLLGQGLLTSEGEYHKKQRLLIQPGFHRQRIAGYATTMVDLTDKHCATWRDGAEVDMVSEMMALTFKIAGKTLFNADVSDDITTMQEGMARSMAAFEKVGTSPWALQLERLPLPVMRRFYKARVRIDETVYRMIEEHRQSGDQGDILSMLLQIKDEEGQGLSPVQLHDEVLTLLAAGHETTANALGWTWYLLSQNPDIRAKMQRVVDEALGDRLPTFEDIPRLAYIEQVMTESMRLYPPVWAFDREATCDVQLRDLTIPKDARVIVSQYATHHDTRYYPDPERFDPDRWTPEARANRPKFAYFPFGGGSRLCIGEAFAWTEGVLALAIMARRWEAELLPNHPIAMEAAVTMRPRYGLRMTLKKRNV